MEIEPHNLFGEHYVRIAQSIRKDESTTIDVDKVKVQLSRDLITDLHAMKNKGLLPVGMAEFVGKGNMGVGLEARTQAAKEGASVVLFRLTPAKLKAIRRSLDGAIDLAAVLADPPASMSPRGYFVVQSFFLARAKPNDA